MAEPAPESAVSRNGVPVRLPSARWEHIQARHPELEGSQQEILVVESPDVIQQGDFGTLMAAKRLDGLYLVVIYREVSPDDGFVITAYFDQPAEAEADGMETIKLEQSRPVTWDYDTEADTLYVSFGKPRPALTLDMGNGFLARYEQDSGELVGFTIVGLSHVAKSKQTAAGE